MSAPVAEISMTVPFVTLSSSLRRLISKSVHKVESIQPSCINSRSSGQTDGPLRPGFASAERILSIRTGWPERIDSTSLCRKYSWLLKDRGAFVESVGAVMVRKMPVRSDRKGVSPSHCGPLRFPSSPWALSRGETFVSEDVMVHLGLG